MLTDEVGTNFLKSFFLEQQICLGCLASLCFSVCMTQVYPLNIELLFLEQDLLSNVEIVCCYLNLKAPIY